MLISLDSRKRVPLGRILRGEMPQLFNAEVVNGKIVLEPMRAIPEREAWLYENPKTLASVKQGLKEKPRHKLPDMSKYLTDDSGSYSLKKGQGENKHKNRQEDEHRDGNISNNI